MPKIFGIPLIGVIQMVLGAVIVLFILIKYKKQPKRKHNGEYVIQDVHILTGDGTESEHKNVYIKKGLIQTKRYFHTESLPLKICVLPDISSISFVNSFVPESWKVRSC